MRRTNSKLETLSVLPLALLCLAGCGPRPTVIQSDDGLATLTIPAGALPRGVDAKQLSITRDDSLATIDQGTVYGWRLEPDGLQLTQPVTLELALEVLPDHRYAGIHVSGDTTEFLEPEVLTDESGAATGIRYALEHFSWVVLADSSGGQLQQWEWLTPARDLAINEVMSPAVRITRGDPFSRQFRVYDGRIIQTVSTGVWRLGRVYWRASPNMEPVKVESPPTAQTTDNFITASENFTCRSAGDYALGAYTIVTQFQTQTSTYSPTGELLETKTEQAGEFGNVNVTPLTATCTDTAPNHVSDPANDCPENSNSTVATCTGGIDITGIDWQLSGDLLCFDVTYREPVLEDPGDRNVIYGFSVLSEPPSSDQVSLRMTWYGATRMWTISSKAGLNEQDDYVLRPGEDISFQNGKLRICLSRSHVEERFQIRVFGTSAQLTYQIGQREFDKSPNHPISL